MTWKVQLFDDRDPSDEDDEGEFELCVVKVGVHGEESEGNGSWGWYDDEKICLLMSGVGGGNYSQETIALVMKHAQNLCDELNGEKPS